MKPRIPLAALGLALLVAGIGSFARAVGPVIVPGKPDRALVVNLYFPPDEEFKKVHALLEKVKARGATFRSLRAAKNGEGASAEVVAEPQTPAPRIAAVVQELLEGGVKEISVEVKK
jgi:hypothetical protein